MFKLNNDLELPPQLKWKFSHEPELLGWTIRARNYNTFVANCMFAFMSLVILSMTHQRMKFAYRFTSSGVECCEWKDFPE
ncbi:hypothetical protein NPS20_26210, partial [Pseudomonas putida]|nr:hypothetical protein [Pseudomonas putida]